MILAKRQQVDRISATANSMDDFDPVTRLDHVLIEAAAWNNLAIDLQCKALAGQAQRIQQLAGTGLVRDGPGGTVDNNIHGFIGAVHRDILP